MTSELRERHVRAHAVRPGDQVEEGKGKWWVVAQPLTANEVVEWTDKDGRQTVIVADWVNPEVHVCFLIKRGSRRRVFISKRDLVVKILRS